jgi:hypothetical protein
MLKKFMLTTIDNPINPFKDWDSWYNMDIALGHDTCGLLNRVCGDLLIDDGSLEDAKKEIVFYNLSGKHLLVDEENFDDLLRSGSEVSD